MKLEMHNGTIEQSGTFVGMTDQGLVLQPKFLATSHHNGESCTFYLMSTASWWLKLIHDRFEARKRRLGLFE